MHARHFNILLSSLFCGCFLGCVSVRDISHDPRYPTGYVVGNVYRLKQPVFAYKADMTRSETYSELFLYCIGDGGPRDYLPPSIEEFEKHKAEWGHVAGVAMPGTLITVSNIQLENHPEYGTMILIHGRLIDVPWAYKSTELAFISHQTRYSGFLLPVLDTNILELATQP